LFCYYLEQNELSIWHMEQQAADSIADSDDFSPSVVTCEPALLGSTAHRGDVMDLLVSKVAKRSCRLDSLKSVTLLCSFILTRPEREIVIYKCILDCEKDKHGYCSPNSIGFTAHSKHFISKFSISFRHHLKQNT